ncbi:GTP-binding protein 1 [Thelohanellus kitauei]|uniref:GTP-binding protein 1 n=1 Tax=Thelohanellus kitauei TaxID=669202 RepID=A0A0C2ND87_THEKT|nr:GTP-binding protein 1 [Thelohanellus kitauei]
MSFETIASPDNDKICFRRSNLGPKDGFQISDEDLVDFSTKIGNCLSQNSYQVYVEIAFVGKPVGNASKDVQDRVLGTNKSNCFNLSFILMYRKENYTHFAFMARPVPGPNSFYEIRIASAGNVDSGKSALMGDGRGLVRSKMFNFQHEVESGRTSSVGESILCVDSLGNLITSNRLLHHKNDCDRVPPGTSKIFDFYDLAGHEKYLKTTIYGLVGLKPDYVFLTIGANMGMVGTTKEHLGLGLALEIPVCFIITKIDMCPDDVRKDTLKKLVRMLRSMYPHKNHIVINNEEDVLIAFANIQSNQLFTIFQVSSVSGKGLDNLRLFLKLLPPRQVYTPNGYFLFWIDKKYSVPGIGCVVSGMIVQGTLNKNDDMLLGPTPEGQFLPIKIKSIHRKRDSVDMVYAGQTCSIALKKIKRDEIRKGMVIVPANSSPVAHWKFKAFVHILHHPTTISRNYQALVHTGSVRQTARIEWLEKDPLRTSDKAHVIMKFMCHPEFLCKDISIVFREGRTKAIGVIKELLDPAKSNETNVKEIRSSVKRIHRKI